MKKNREHLSVLLHLFLLQNIIVILYASQMCLNEFLWFVDNEKLAVRN